MSPKAKKVLKESLHEPLTAKKNVGASQPGSSKDLIYLSFNSIELLNASPRMVSSLGRICIEVSVGNTQLKTKNMELQFFEMLENTCGMVLYF